MSSRKVFLSASILAGMIFTIGAYARFEEVAPSGKSSGPAIVLAQGTGMQGHTTAPSGAPTTGSEQSLGQATSPGPMVTSPTGTLPQTGSQQGVNSHNSAPMPSGMVMPSAAGQTAPMVGSAGNPVPTTGSAQGAESPNSMPPGHMAADPNKK